MIFRRITQEELDNVLKSHEDWLNDNTSGIRADLRYTDLGMFDLHGVNLSHAYLDGANLSDVNLRGAILYGANLHYANLSNANLSNADLIGANLRDSVLRYADLSYTNLSGADLEGANLFRVDLTNAIGNLLEYRKGKILAEPLIGYKKCQDGIIVTLEIPKGATVFSINGYKCRTNKVKVIAVDGADKAISCRNNMSYYVGDEITINDFECEYNVECALGIHFFMNRKEAEEYYMV